MLRSLDDLICASVTATDGEVGSVRNVLFDDRSWMIRYMVIDVGHWLARRDVVISVSAIDQPDWVAKTFPAHLTKEQVRHSPDVDSQKPVSRQQEIAMREYYGWPAYWDTFLNPEFASVSIPVGRRFPVHTQEDPHLRSTEDVIGYRVWATDGLIGCLESFIVDEASWHLGYLDVKAGDWLYNRSILVPSREVTSVLWADHRINLDRARQQI